MRVPSLFLAVLFTASCGTAPEPTPDAGDAVPDAGESTPDAGEATPDAGGTPDAGTVVDQSFGGALTYEVNVPAGSFEPSNTEQNGRPLNLAYTATHPNDSIARLERYANAEIAGPPGFGMYGFRMKSNHLFQTGESEANRVEISFSSFLGNVIEGVTYEFSAWLRNPGSASWAGPGPDLGFVVNGEPRRTSIAIGTLPEGEWKNTKVSYTGTAADAGKTLGILVGVYGNSPGADQRSPELWVDGLTVKVTTAQSIALENADFAAPAVTGDTETLPTGWTLVSRTNALDTVGLVNPPAGDIVDEIEGRQFLHIDNAYVFQQGDTDVRTVVESGVVAKAVPGKRYVFFARFRDYGSMTWGGNGPKLAVKVGSAVTGYEASIIGIKGWGNDDAGALVVAGPFTQGQAGEEVRLQFEVWGHAYQVAGAHPEIYVSGLAMGVQ